jgi:hypothetical protein
MKIYPAPKTPEWIVDEIRAMAAAGSPQELMIARMRKSGLSIAPSIKLLSEVCGMDLGDAKRAVHFSSTWADCLQANDALHEAAYQAAIEEGFEVVEIEKPEKVAAAAH